MRNKNKFKITTQLIRQSVSQKVGGDMLLGRKLIYLSIPFRGDEVRAKRIMDTVCRMFMDTEPDGVPISPIHAFSFTDDDDPYEREMALQYCLSLLEACDELWVFGKWQDSEGCRLEVAAAHDWGIPTKFFGERGPQIVHFEKEEGEIGHAGSGDKGHGKGTKDYKGQQDKKGVGTGNKDIQRYTEGNSIKEGDK